MDKKRILMSALASVVALGVTAGSAQAEDHSNMEKCYGVSKSKMNDCSATNHPCAGQASKDGDPTNWVYVPKGLCDKLVGGSLTAGGETGGDTGTSMDTEKAGDTDGDKAGDDDDS